MSFNDVIAEMATNSLETDREMWYSLNHGSMYGKDDFVSTMHLESPTVTFANSNREYGIKALRIGKKSAVFVKYKIFDAFFGNLLFVGMIYFDSRWNFEWYAFISTGQIIYKLDFLRTYNLWHFRSVAGDSLYGILFPDPIMIIF